MPAGKFGIPARIATADAGYVLVKAPHTPEVAMAFDDKVDNKSEEIGGKVKEGVGKATDDERLEGEGKADQTSSKLKQAGENIKDAFKS
jgi:uncharacterized protein YjbJ (UPF0337 family)